MEKAIASVLHCFPPGTPRSALAQFSGQYVEAAIASALFADHQDDTALPQEEYSDTFADGTAVLKPHQAESGISELYLVMRLSPYENSAVRRSPVGFGGSKYWVMLDVTHCQESGLYVEVVEMVAGEVVDGTVDREATAVPVLATVAKVTIFDRGCRCLTL